MKFKSLLFTIALFSVLSCSKQSNLTDSETAILTKIKFDNDVASELKTETKNVILQLPAIDKKTSEVLTNETFEGIYSQATKDNAESIVRNLKPGLKKKGYLIFYSENEKGYFVAIIKGTDDLDILKYRKSNGINYGLENDDIIKKMEEWQTKYGISVIGCELDYVHIDFDKLPENMDEFAKEVYKFCPDSVDQGVGNIESLKEYIQQEKGIFLWWD
ncbi:MAG: DUF4253 domain-containing protein [Flavobacterium sp.]|nr:MAG: DUF4253 domain-containing protein [Flavobacterium sp.]